MAQIVLTEEQLRIVESSAESIEVLDSSGRLVASFVPLSPIDDETLRECRRRLASDQPRIPSAQVRLYLARLGEIREREGLDREKAFDLLRRLLAGEQI